MCLKVNYLHFSPQPPASLLLLASPASKILVEMNTDGDESSRSSTHVRSTGIYGLKGQSIKYSSRLELWSLI